MWSGKACEARGECTDLLLTWLFHASILLYVYEARLHGQGQHPENPKGTRKPFELFFCLLGELD